MSPSPSVLKLLCDENVPMKVNGLLEKKGFDVKRTPSGASDEKVAELSISESRVLITFDRHFANTLLYHPEKYPGIIFLRISPPLIKATFDALLNLFNSVEPLEFKGRLFVLSHEGFRVFPKTE